MEGFNQETSLQQLELNGSAVFSTSSGSSRENELDILHLFGKEKLENIQKSLSKATGAGVCHSELQRRADYREHQLFPASAAWPETTDS